jgi:Asp-tRNA(Asn)/Glu-tRNA(Gln) amidotransferase A subunit family amidase
MTIDAEYERHDALGLAELVRKGEVTPAELLECALVRARRHDPALGCLVHLDPERGRRAIARLPASAPFRGVPFLLKDLHAYDAGAPVTFGSRLFRDFVPDHDSELVARYKRAGLVIFGRSTSPEFGLTSTTESALYGPTRNPWNLAHTPGGSSGGAAAAVAAGILPLANASDGGGSIRIPASCCGLFGLKPTRGRTPMGPDVGEGWGGLSTVHAVSRTVRDSAALLDATAGPDTGAPYFAERPRRPWLDEVGANPGRLRIAWQVEGWNGAPTHPDCARAAEDAARLCAELGHEVEQSELEVDREALGRAVQAVIGSNTRATVEDRVAVLGRPLAPDDIEPITRAMVERAREVTGAEYARGVRVIHATGRQVARFLERYDVLLTPTMATPPLPLGRLSLSRTDMDGYVEDVGRTVAFTSLFNIAGNPAMSLPLSWNGQGLPIGVQFAGRYGDEATLFRLAGQLERARPWFDRRPALSSA